MPIILTAIISLVGLLVLHELSHFLVAKAFGMRVREFGIGYPPRIFGKKIGETVYSLNLIPFGAFVDIPQEDMRKGTVWQRFLVLMAGVISFWIFSFVIFSIIFMIGSPVQVEEGGSVQIVRVMEESPAMETGIRSGDIIRFIGNEEIDSVEEAQDVIGEGGLLELNIQRGEEDILLDVEPGDSGLGVMLIQMDYQKWGFWKSLELGCRETIDLTVLMLRESSNAIKSIFTSTETQASFIGPVGIMQIFVDMGGLGLVYFLRTMAMISINLAIINSFPLLPITDGGRVLFLALEKIRKKPLNEGVEKGVNKFFFALLIALMVVVTISDVLKILR